MSMEFTPPLAIHFTWHPSDSEKVNPLLDEIRRYFARDKDKPFSRGLNIPLFFYSSAISEETPQHSPEDIAERNVKFVFTSRNTVGNANWVEYLEQIGSSEFSIAVPVALDRYGLNHQRKLKGANAIRAYEWLEDNWIINALVSIAHEIFRHGLVGISPEKKGKDSSIKLFLSHAKAGGTGVIIAKAIKEYVDTTNMNRFFDATEISPGVPFDREIERHIPGSTLVAIVSDLYSSRYWCQREVMLAKKENCPTIVVDCLEEYEDRIFPPASNIPCVHVTPNDALPEKDILRILLSAIIETIRYKHSTLSIMYYQSQGWIDKNCAVLSRPLEVRQALDFAASNILKVCYPEPPVYTDETDWHRGFKIEAHTPLWNPEEKDSLAEISVGISISNFTVECFSKIHIHLDHLKRLSQDLARHLLARSATLIYGGDLRKDGFTEFILDEASALRERLNGDVTPVENHLAWPLYLANQDIITWRAKYRPVMNTVEHPIPDDIAGEVDSLVFTQPNSTPNNYIWSRCLSTMREASISASSARVCAGGKLSGYKGKMPGVLEEIVIALDQGKPVYLLGAFRGITGAVCDTILGGTLSSELSEGWQIANNAGYADLLKYAKGKGHAADYSSIEKTLFDSNPARLAQASGLSEGDYLRLMCSPFIDECVHLIIKGLKTIKPDL